MTPENDIIAAVATPPGLSALAVVRLSGPGCCALVEGLAGLEGGRLRGMRRAVAVIPRAGDVVALAWPEGGSYTGEEMVELICHGIPEFVSALLDAVIGAGARGALPGEFTGRAWRNGRVSGQQILALAAAVETGRKADPLDVAVPALQKMISKALEDIEGSIEFPEESSRCRHDPVDALEAAVGSARELLESAQGLSRAAKVYLTGRVNAGKSTLMNTLCGSFVALVHPEPGTTRDGARREVSLQGRRFLLIDTPGFGGGALDGAALAASLSGIRPEDMVVWLSPGGEGAPEVLLSRGARVLTVLSKSDTHSLNGQRVSSVTGEGVGELVKCLVDMSSSPAEHMASRVLSLLLEARATADQEPGIAAGLIREAETIAEEITGIRHDLTAVERALSVLCVGK